LLKVCQIIKIEQDPSGQPALSREKSHSFHKGADYHLKYSDEKKIMEFYPRELSLLDRSVRLIY